MTHVGALRGATRTTVTMLTLMTLMVTIAKGIHPVPPFIFGLFIGMSTAVLCLYSHASNKDKLNALAKAKEEQNES